MARTAVADGDTQKVNRTDVEPHHTHKDLESGLATLHDAYPDVQAFALFALKDDGRIDLCASKHVQPFIDAPKFDARADLSKAHETAVHSAFIFDDANISDRDADIMDEADSVLIIDTASAPSNKPETRRRHRASSTKLGRPRKSPHPHFEQPATFETPDDVPTDPTDDEPVPKTARATAFMIDEEDKVKAFLYDRIGRIHQLSDKKIAKAWIKGICPKKQAIFPYQNKQREKEFGQPPVVPAWWPPVELCPFVEPDHITRDHRNNLLVHLLRLRPEADQLRVWNNDKSEPHPTHKHVGWTAFLRELAPIDSLDEITPTAENKVKNRRNMLADVYRIAEMEEDFKRFGMVQQVQDISVEKPSSSKRSRRAASEATSAESTSNVLSRSSSPSPIGRAPSKRPCRESTRLMSETSTFAVAEEDEVMTETMESRSRTQHSGVPAEAAPKQAPLPVAQRRKTDQKPTVSDVKRQRRSHPTIEQWRTARRVRHQAAMQQQWQASQAPLTTSFDSSTSGPAQQFDPYEAHMGGQSMFPGNHNYAFPQARYPDLPQLQPQPQPQHRVQVYQTMQVPEPHFDTVPNTPTLTPASMMYQQHLVQPGAYDMAAVANSMPVSQPMTMPMPMVPSQQDFHVPAGYVDHHVGPHSVSHYHDHAYGMQHAEAHRSVGHGLLPEYARRDVQMQYGGLPVNHMDHQVANGFQHLPYELAGHPT